MPLLTCLDGFKHAQVDWQREGVSDVVQLWQLRQGEQCGHVHVAHVGPIRQCHAVLSCRQRLQQKQHRGGLPRGVQHINAHQHSCIQLVKQCCEAIKLNELMQPLNTAIEYGAERGNQRENQSWTSILALSRDGRHWPGILKSDAHLPSGQQSSPGRPHRGRCRGRSEDPCPAQLSLRPACDWPGQCF